MEALDNKCPSCGAKIDWDPVSQSFSCLFCGSKYSLEEMKKYENASNDRANTVNKNNESFDGFINHHCKNCGAEIIADATTTATFCVYCGSTAILKEKIDSGIAPTMIIPFKKTKEDARDAFSRVTKGKPLMPKAFKQVSNIEKISGVYIPFWAYDISCDGDVTFACHDVSHWSDSEYSYTKTSNYEVVVNEHTDYEKVLADGSSRFDDELMDSIEPFNFKGLVEYNHAYLAGFLAEKYDVSDVDAYTRATDRTLNTCIELARGVTHHQSSSVKTNNINMVKKNTDYIMLPVWMVRVKYKDKFYTFAMNGQTGKIVGDIPVGVKETIFWGLLIFMICFTIGIIIVIGG